MPAHSPTKVEDGKELQYKYLLKCLLELVEVNSRVVAHDADSAYFVKGLEVGSLDLLALQEHVTNRLVGGTSDFELQEVAVVALDLVEDEHAADKKKDILRKTDNDRGINLLQELTHDARAKVCYVPADGHLVGGQGTGLVGADDGGATQGLDGGQGAHDGVLLGHTAGTEGKASGDDSGQTFRDGGHSQRDSDFEVVHGTLGRSNKTWVTKACAEGRTKFREFI